MRNLGYSKLIYFLSALSLDDRLRLHDYLHSPLFNRKEAPRRFYDYLQAHCLQASIQEIDDAAAMRAVWPGEAPHPKRLERLKSVMVNHVLGYLEFRNWQSKPTARQLALIEELNGLDDESYLPQFYRKALDDLEQGQDLETFRLRLGIEAQYMHFLQKHKARTDDNHLAETILALEDMLLAHLLKFAYVAANQSVIVNTVQIPNWITESANRIPVSRVENDPLLEIYYLLYVTLVPDAHESDLDRLKFLVLTHAATFSPMEAYDIFTGALNNLNRQMQAQGREKSETVLQVYQSMVEIHAKKMKQGLLPWHFKNIVSMGARLGKFDWVEEFLKEGKVLLKEDADGVKVTLAYNYGVFYFYKGEHQQAIRHFHLALPSVKDIFYAIGTRTFLLMCFYETGDSMAMEALLHSFRMFLERSDRLATSHKQKYLAFVRVFRRLLSTPLQDQIRLQQLKAEMDLLQDSVAKPWLLQKVAALLQKN